MAEAMFDSREMLILHDMFRREFVLLPGPVRRVPAGDQERARAVAEHIDRLTGILHDHLVREDALVWPLLLDRCADDVIPVVQLMENQYDQLSGLLDEVGRTLDGWRDNAAADAGAALAGVLDRLVPVLRDHLRTEERRIIPLMERNIPAAEWDEIVRMSVFAADLATMPLIFGMLMYEGDPEVIEVVLTHLPPQARDAVRERGPRVYAAHAEQIHGTATPPRGTEL